MRFAKFAAVLALPALGLLSSAFGGVVYTQTSTTGLTSNSALLPIALDDINFSAGATASSPQRLSGLTFGVVVAANTPAQTASVFLDFYNDVNPASTGIVETNYLGGFSGNLTITASTTAAARAFTFSALNTLSTPIDFNDDSIGVVITLANAGGTSYSTILSPLTSVPGTPTVGSSLPGLYRDLLSDGNFQATDFNAAAGNLYLSMTTVNAPEPTSLGLAGLVGMGALARRRRAI